MTNSTPKGKEDSSDCFTLLAPAKVNLGLRITARRADGYHDLCSLFVPLSIGDRLEISVRDAGWEGACDRSDVPMGEGSLVERAFRYAAARLGFQKGLAVRIEKEIPMGAGLGGGSSDAAAVMRAVERLTKRSIPETDYPEIAYRIGADVPFFLKDGPKWVEGIGERVTPVVRMPPLHILLVHPGLSIATKWVYSNLNIPTLTTQKTTANVPPAFDSVDVLLPFLTNDLESVVLAHFPVIGELKSRLIDLGADAALMSGSGSTVFGLYSDSKKRNQALEALRREDPRWWICGAHSGVV